MLSHAREEPCSSLYSVTVYNRHFGSSREELVLAYAELLDYALHTCHIIVLRKHLAADEVSDYLVVYLDRHTEFKQTEGIGVYRCPAHRP